MQDLVRVIESLEKVQYNLPANIKEEIESMRSIAKVQPKSLEKKNILI